MELGSILLIDDNVVQAATRQAILKNVGYTVVTALDPRRALDLLRQRNLPDPIWLVITDHLMPGMSGAVLVRHLRASSPDLPVIVISGLEEAEQEYEGLNVLFRLKPLKPESLLESVAQLRLAPKPVPSPPRNSSNP